MSQISLRRDFMGISEARNKTNDSVGKIKGSVRGSDSAYRLGNRLPLSSSQTPIKYHEVFKARQQSAIRDNISNPLKRLITDRSASSEYGGKNNHAGTIKNESQIYEHQFSKPAPSFSDVRSLPPVVRFALPTLSNGSHGDSQQIKNGKKFINLSNDISLPQILTKTTNPRGSTDRRELKISKNADVGSFLQRIRGDNQLKNPSLALNKGYYVKKLHLALLHGVEIAGGDFIDHFQKNYEDLKKVKNEKIMVDYHLKQVILPPSIHDRLLVLDLDETLVHCCNFDGKMGKNTIVKPIKTSLGNGILKFNVRPGVEKFLREMSSHYQIVVFTASDKDYAKSVLNHIDPEQFVCKLLTRDSCSFTRSGHLVKDLRIFQNRDISKMVLVDNTAKCSLPQFDNSIPILPFINNDNDSELEELGQFLIQLKGEKDIPGFLKRYFQMHRYHESLSHNQLLSNILANFK